MKTAKTTATTFLSTALEMCHPTFTDKKVCRPSVAICFATTLTPFVKPCTVLRGYLDVAIAKIRETRMQSCAIDLQTCSFAKFLQWLHLNNLAKKSVSETCEKRSQKYLVSESRVHLWKYLSYFLFQHLDPTL